MDSPFSQFRRSSFTDRWVLVATGRAQRPTDWAEVEEPEPVRDPFDPLTVKADEIIDKIPNNDGTKYSEPSNWKALAVVNVYPIVSPGDKKPKLAGNERDGYGFHEIIVHSPDRDKNFEEFTPEQTQAVLELYLKRYNHLAHMPNIKHVQIFTNRGKSAGASIIHPHSQIMALPIVPPYIERIVKTARNHYRDHGHDVITHEIEQESQAAVRVIYENSKFLVYCPYAPHANYHIRIIPKQPGAHFHEMTQEQLEHLSRMINMAFLRLDRIAGHPPYNTFIRTAPIHDKHLEGFRWHIDILPHLTQPGGFELATGIDVVTVTPEDAARALRKGA